jgi:hypothetical protein
LAFQKPFGGCKVAREKDLVLDYITTLEFTAQSNLWIDTADPQYWVLKGLDGTLPLKHQFISFALAHSERSFQILLDSNNMLCGFNRERWFNSSDKCIFCDQFESPCNVVNACQRRREMGYNPHHDGALNELYKATTVENIPNLIKKGSI